MFSQTSAGRTKLHTLVDFPLTGLDVTEHVEPRTKRSSPESHSLGWGTWGRKRASSVSGSDENLYDLYAVCNHTGGMTGGHYTAYCKNPVDFTWYLFDDMRVEKISKHQIVTKAAYLLFYTRRNVGSSSASESSSGSEHWVWRMPQFSYESVFSSRDELSSKEDSTTGRNPFFFFLYIVVCHQIIFGLWMCHMFLRIHLVTTTSLSSDIDNELTIITTFINLQYLDSSLLFITFLREHNLTGLLFSLECIKEDN